MTIEELKAKGFIDIEDDISFQNHSEVMELFGAVRINKQISFYKHPHEEGVHIWFPVFYQDGKAIGKTHGDKMRNQRSSAVSTKTKNI